MTPQQQSLIMALVAVPGRRRALSNEAFLKDFGATDGNALGLRLLRDAARRRDPIDTELALVVCFQFGLTAQHLSVLIELAFADWHQRHEDVADALGDIASPAAVQALAHLAQWVPDYLEFDDARALAVKAVHALGALGDDAAQSTLRELAESESQIVAAAARRQLARQGQFRH